VTNILLLLLGNVGPVVLTHITNKYVFQRRNLGLKNDNVGAFGVRLVGGTRRIGAKDVVGMR